MNTIEIRVGHCQLECTTGDYEANMSKVLSGLAWADDERIDIVSFPESFLTGYFSSAEKASQHSFVLDGPEITQLLEETAKFKTAFMVGFNERQDDKLYNTVLIAEKGKLLGTYSKAFPCYSYFTPGRNFPVFEKKGVKFGVVICADGGYIEPTRILALKGAELIFAPHYNYISKEGLLNHFRSVRSDHTARARENSVWFLRGNNVSSGFDEGIGHEGVGYGDSYLMDPMGEIVVRSQRHIECTISANIPIRKDDLTATPFFTNRKRRSVKSGKALGSILMKTLDAIPACTN